MPGPDDDAAPKAARQAYRGVRTGGRSARVRRALLDAAIVELAEGDPDGLSLPRVAERAGVHLSTVHRRWATKADLILEALAEATAGRVPDPCGATLREDLHALASSVSAMVGDPTTTKLLRAAFRLPDEQLAALRERFWPERFELAGAIVARAVERGELPAGVDGWDVVEPIHATIWMRHLITGLPVDDALVDRLVDRAIEAAQPPSR